MNRIYIAKTDRISPDFNGEFTEYHKAKFIKATCEKRKKEILGGMLLFCKGLSDMGISPEDITIKETLKGKPYIDSFPCFFNISHSGGYVICVFSEEETGCDMEILRKVNFKIAEKYFSEEEKSFIGNSDSLFLRLWVLKESLLKLSAEGITDIENTAFEFSDNTPKKDGFSFFEFSGEDYVASVCTKNKINFQIKETEL